MCAVPIAPSKSLDIYKKVKLFMQKLRTMKHWTESIPFTVLSFFSASSTTYRDVRCRPVLIYFQLLRSTGSCWVNKEEWQCFDFFLTPCFQLFSKRTINKMLHDALKSRKQYKVAIHLYRQSRNFECYLEK